MEKSVEKTARVKKASNKNAYVPEIVTRRCHILDAYIIEQIPISGFIQYLAVSLKDLDDGTILLLNTTLDELSSIGINLTTKSMIDLAGWLKTHQGVIEIKIPDNITKITIDMLLGAMDGEAEHVESEPDQKSEFTVQAVKKFGRK